MRQILVCVASLTLLGSSVCIFAQSPVNLNFNDKPVRSLSALAANQLSDPAVQTGIKATPEQLMRGLLRLVIEPIRKVAVAKITSSDDADQMMQALNFTGEMTGMKLDDLDSHQRQRLFEITAQETPLRALLTDEISFAIHLTDRQKKNLDSIYADVAAKERKLVLNSMQRADVKKLAAEMTKLAGDDKSEPTVEQVNTVLDKVIQGFPKIFSSLTAQETPTENYGNRMAMKVLTSEQRRAFKKLQGKPLPK